MPLFRVLRSLSKRERVIPAGELTDLHWLTDEQRQKLMAVGAVAPIQTPPIAALPGWKTRAAKLITAGIYTVEDALETQVAALADAGGVRHDTAERWLRELREWVVVPPTDSGG